MKQEELKASLSKIVPSEELIQTTLLKMEEQKRKADRPAFSFWRSSGYRYAAAFCVLFLIFGIGIGSVISRNNGNTDNLGLTNPSSSGIERRNIQTTDEGQNPNVAHYSLEDDTSIGMYEVQGTLEACYLTAVIEEERAQGIIACGILEIAPFTGEDNISVKMYFYDSADLNTITGAISKGISIGLMPLADDDKAAWVATDFAIKAAK